MLGKNKGPKSEETKRKISETLVKSGVSSGVNNSMHGRSLSLTPEAEAERRRKISEAQTGKKRERPIVCSVCSETGHNRRRCPVRAVS